MSFPQRPYLANPNDREESIMKLKQKLRQRRQLDNQIQNMLISGAIGRKYFQLEKDRLGPKRDRQKTRQKIQQHITKYKDYINQNNPISFEELKRMQQRERVLESIRRKYQSKQQHQAARTYVPSSSFRLYQQNKLVGRNMDLAKQIERLRRKQQQAIHNHELARSINRIQKYLYQKEKQDLKHRQLEAKERQVMAEAFREKVNELTQKCLELNQQNRVLEEISANENILREEFHTSRSPQRKRYNYLSSSSEMSPYVKLREEQQALETQLISLEKQREILKELQTEREVQMQVQLEKEKLRVKDRMIEEDILREVERENTVRREMDKLAEMEREMQKQRLLEQAMRQKQKQMLLFDKMEREKQRLRELQLQEFQEREKLREKLESSHKKQQEAERQRLQKTKARSKSRSRSRSNQKSRYKQRSRSRSRSNSKKQQQGDPKFFSCPKFSNSPCYGLNKNVSPQGKTAKFNLQSPKIPSFAQSRASYVKNSRKNKSKRKNKDISIIDDLTVEQANYFKNIANSRIQRRIRFSKGIFKDSEYRGKKHEIHHLNHTFQLERRARSEVKERISSNPKVLKKHALVVN